MEFRRAIGQAIDQHRPTSSSNTRPPTLQERPNELQQLAAPFFAPAATQAPTSYDFQGTRLVVIHQSAGSFCALSRRRALGLAARHLPCGVLLASFQWPTPAQTVVAELDRCCALLQT